MADNVILPGDGLPVATDEVAGIHFQLVKLDLGGDGVSVPVVGSIPVSVSGGATSALQATGNGALSQIEAAVESIDSKTPTVGQKTAANSSSVVLASDQSAIPVSGTVAVSNLTDPATATAQTALQTSFGARADASATSDTGSFSLLAFIKRGMENWTTLLGRIPSLSAGRIPVVLPPGNQLTQLAGKPTAFWPNYGAPDSAADKFAVFDSNGGLSVRSAVLTDEGTFRVNFTNTSLAVAIGNVTIAGRVVTGTGFASADVHLKDYFKLDADAESAWSQIASIDSDTQLTLSASYIGGTSGAASRALVQPSTGAGAAIAVASGKCSMTLGTTSGAVTFVNRSVDYAPLVFRGRIDVSQRVANQNIRIGFSEPNPTPKWFARFRLEGADANTVIRTESARNPTSAPSAAETETNTITLPNGLTTTSSLDYRVEMLTEVCRFYVNEALVAEHSRCLPSAYDLMASGVLGQNTGVPASSTVVGVDFVTVKNHNKLEMSLMSKNEQIVAAEPVAVTRSFTQAGVIAINTRIIVVDCLQLRSLSLHCTSMGATGVAAIDWSADGVTWQQNASLTPINGGASVTSFNAAGMWTTPVLSRFASIRIATATTAGTTTINVVGFQSDIATKPNQAVTFQAQPTITVAQGTAANLQANVRNIAVTPTNQSGAITTGGTAQQAIALNANRRGFAILNISAGDLWFSEVATAVVGSPSIRIPSNGYYENPPGLCATTAISIIGATTAQAYVAREYT